MARGPKKHLKRIAAPKSWMLDKLGGIYTTRPSQGPHKLRECLPLAVVLRKLKYAMNGREVMMIINDKDNGIKIDHKIRRDRGFPCGAMDVISIDKCKENFRVLLDEKGRFTLVRIEKEEARFKLLRVRHKKLGANRVPYIVTHDARTIRYPHPEIEVRDTVKFDLVENKIVEWYKFEEGNKCFITGGNNIGRVGVITSFQKHEGGFDMAHVKDRNGHSFSTRVDNLFVLGKGDKSVISLPKHEGIKLSIVDERKRKMSQG